MLMINLETHIFCNNQHNINKEEHFFIARGKRKRDKYKTFELEAVWENEATFSSWSLVSMSELDLNVDKKCVISFYYY